MYVSLFLSNVGLQILTKVDAVFARNDINRDGKLTRKEFEDFLNVHGKKDWIGRWNIQGRLRCWQKIVHAWEEQVWFFRMGQKLNSLVTKHQVICNITVQTGYLVIGNMVYRLSDKFLRFCFYVEPRDRVAWIPPPASLWPGGASSRNLETTLLLSPVNCPSDYNL